MTTSIGATSGSNTSFINQVNSGKVCVSAEGLMIYLQTRLGSLDDRINQMFDKQETAQTLHEHINAIQKKLGELKDDPSVQGSQQCSQEWIDEVQGEIDAIEEIDPDLGDQIRNNLTGDGGALCGNEKDEHVDTTYGTKEIKNSEDYLNSVTKSLESSAQLQMIELQSLMSNRQTAVQLSTNLISSDSDAKKGIVNNIK